jgi:hypothetical protein
MSPNSYYTVVDYSVYAMAATLVIAVIGTALYLMFTRN